jgi:HSP20 family protein
MMIRRLPAVRRGPFLLETGFSRFMNELLGDFERAAFDVAPSYGSTDVYEKDRHLVFETELPGLKKEEISIKVEDDRLILSGELKRDEEIDRENYFRMARRYGRFQRCFPLPANLIEKDQIKARFENGILRVSAPLKESIKEKELPIEIAVE